VEYSDPFGECVETHAGRQVGENLPMLKHLAMLMVVPASASRPSRRDRRRQETIDDIKATARGQLAERGPAGISLRAIARHLDMTASAVHYYFPSRRALLDALIVDGFGSLADALRSRYESAATAVPPAEQWLAVCRAHRAWALGHQSEYLLLYGHDGGGAAKRRHPRVQQAMSNIVDVLFAIMRNAVATGEIDTEGIEAATPTPLRGQLASWRDAKHGIGELPDGALAACMIAYAQLHGAITLELVAHVPSQLTDHSALFDLEMVHAYASLCRQR
jgi:AcrR family transcriptional regulator